VVQRTHYQVLGVRTTASTPEIRRAYRQLAYLLHPDRQAGTTEAEARLADRRMREVNVAWTTLSDPSRRSAYDRSLAPRTTTTAPRPTTTGSSASPGSAGSSGSGQWWDSDDPDAALARVKAAGVEPDEPDLSTAQFWLLRRGPVVVMVTVGLVIFIASAYAGRGASSPSATSAPPAVVADSDCVKLMPNNMAYNVSCDGGYDARIVREEPVATSCLDDGLEVAVVGAKSYCVDSDG